jgi:hypothetical protein
MRTRHACMQATALLVLACAARTSSAAELMLAPAAAVQAVADGKPWLARPQSGPEARLTLHADGTGRFEGPMTFAASWAVRGRDICITIGPLATKCLQFRRVNGGFEGLSAGRPDIVLVR